MSKFFTGFFITLAILAAICTGGFLYLKHYNAHLEQAANSKKNDISITFIEGTRREEMGILLEQKGICKYSDFIEHTQDLEGHLFPDTYRFYENTPASEVVTKMLTNYQNKIKNLNAAVSSTQLIVASIVEREAALDEDRADIAGVYQNRLDQNMKLDADPTVQYGRDNNNLGINESSNQTSFSQVSKFSFWTPITQADYSNVASAYNTYINKGLPPTPICNPGLKSIQAAINPTQHNYLYFFTRNKKAYFSETLEEHESKL